MAEGIGAALPLFGNAVSQLFGSQSSAAASMASAQGSTAAAEAYDKAAEIARNNKRLSAMSTAITETQLDRQINLTLGKQGAQVSGAGFTHGGSAGDLLRSSIQQGGLAKAVMGIKGQIEVNAYEAQATNYAGMASQARSAAQAATSSASSSSSGGLFGSILSGAGALFTLFSDARLKDIIKHVDTLDGIRIYEFRYMGDDRTWKGVIAQEVRNTHPWAVSEGPGGYLMVDYERLGFTHLIVGGEHA